MKGKIFAMFAVAAMILMGFGVMTSSAVTTSASVGNPTTPQVIPVIDGVSVSPQIKKVQVFPPIYIGDINENLIWYPGIYQYVLTGYTTTVFWHLHTLGSGGSGGVSIVSASGGSAEVSVGIGPWTGKAIQDTSSGTSFATTVYVGPLERDEYLLLPNCYALHEHLVYVRAGVKYGGYIGTYTSTEVITYGPIMPLSATLSPETVPSDSVSFQEFINGLPDDVFKNNPDQRKNALVEKINEVAEEIVKEDYEDAVDKLNHDIRAKMDGSVDGNPNNDWITDPEIQEYLCIVIDAFTAELQEQI